MRLRWCRLAVEVFLFIISHFFNIVKWPSLHQRTHTPFFKYNIIFFYVSQVAALTSPLFWYRTDCSGPRFDASEASIKNVEWMAIWCLEDDVPRFQPAWANRTLAPIGICDPALGNGPTAVSGVRAFLASLDNSDELAGSAISGELANHFGIRMHA